MVNVGNRRLAPFAIDFCPPFRNVSENRSEAVGNVGNRWKTLEIGDLQRFESIHRNGSHRCPMAIRARSATVDNG